MPGWKWKMHSLSITFFVLIIALTFVAPLLPTVGAASHTKKRSARSNKDGAYEFLARAIQPRLNTPTDVDGGSGSTQYDAAALSSALRSLSTTQAALKKIDGTAHEMYQRTHRSSTSLDGDGGGDGGGDDEVGGLKVAGRMSRQAARVGCIADALFAAELCELVRRTSPADRGGGGGGAEAAAPYDEEGEEGTLGWTDRRVVLNATVRADPSSSRRHDLSLSVLVVYEPEYDGGAGIGHGGVDDLLSFSREDIAGDKDWDEAKRNSTDAHIPSPRGRYLVILADHCGSPDTSAADSSSCSELSSIVSILDTPPLQVKLPFPVGNDAEASACEPLYHMAGRVLEAIGPVLLKDQGKAFKESSVGDSAEVDKDAGRAADTIDAGDSSSSLPAIHFVGYSLAGGVGAIAANILEGSLPQQGGKDKEPQRTPSLSGAARARTSALCLGPPPCLSPACPSPFVTSVIHGDDVVCRTTRGTLDRLCARARRQLRGGALGRSLGWVSAAAALTATAAGRGGGGDALRVPGRAFLVRPRRLGGGSSSIHEAGGRGREVLRAALLWRLHDVLLSRSLWAHHGLEAYIRSLDRVRLKGFSDGPAHD